MSGQESQPVDIVIDLHGDWIEILRNDLSAAGYSVPASDDALAVAVKYFNVHLGDIELKHRPVFRASGLSYDSSLGPAIDEIERKAIAGEDLTPHLSTRFLDINYHDPLMNDRGLHHLHLGSKLRGDGFIERTGALLFAKVTEESLYVVAVLDHDDWANERLLEEIVASWPELLEPYEMNGVVGLGTVISAADRKGLRKANVSTMTQQALRPTRGGLRQGDRRCQIVARRKQGAAKARPELLRPGTRHAWP